MLALLFLMFFPLAAAALLLVVRGRRGRATVVAVSAAVIALASCGLAAGNAADMWRDFAAASPAADAVCAVVGAACSLVVIGFAVRHRRPFVCALAVVQLVGSLVFELTVAHGAHVSEGLYLDPLTLLMAVIIGVIGSGICVYALGYMEDFQAHEPAGAKDRRPVFFALMFLFLSAMFLIVFSNNMAWMFCGWEVTTTCSFLLIGYTRTKEALNNAFRQIIMNMLGGLAFLGALWACATTFGTLDFKEFVSLGQASPELAALPVALLAFAGLTKAAQMPFHTWLLGAMVAPTPTSALLHSSTMVKAGVFLLVKLSPLFAVCALPQMMTVAAGAVTFLLCSFMAISQSNAKRVLAYSTVANLGLIAVCAGVATPEAVWAACFLILFHAAAKSLLFLCVGTAEHHIGSRDIEDMDLLFERMPRLARLMMVGIMVMFVAPFGMLVSKWAVIVSLAEAGWLPVVVVLAFGSAATFLFWAKWLGKLSGIAGVPANVEGTVHASERFAHVLMAVLALGCCVVLPVISDAVAAPYAASLGAFAVPVSDGNLWVAAALSVVMAAVLLCGLGRKGGAQSAPAYLAGVSADDGSRTFYDSLGATRQATARNLYLESAFGERILSPAGSLASAALMAVLVLASAAPYVM